MENILLTIQVEVNMNQYFCTYEQSVALKNLGFDEPCFGTFMLDAANGKNPFTPSIDYCTKVQLDHGLAPKNSEYTVESQWVSAPLKSQAFQFFRYKYRLYHNIETGSDYINLCYIFENSKEYILGHYSSYEEAENACINKLIEITTNKTI